MIQIVKHIVKQHLNVTQSKSNMLLEDDFIII